MFFLAPAYAMLTHTFQVTETLTVSNESRLLNLLLNLTQMYSLEIHQIFDAYVSIQMCYFLSFFAILDVSLRYSLLLPYSSVTSACDS